MALAHLTAMGRDPFVMIAAKERWLIDSGARLLPVPERHAWDVWVTDQAKNLAAGAVSSPMPQQVAEDALRALMALKSYIEARLDRELPDQEVDELVNDLEAVDLTTRHISQVVQPRGR